jgi:hypothetical protein
MFRLKLLHKMIALVWPAVTLKIRIFVEIELLVSGTSI